MCITPMQAQVNMLGNDQLMMSGCRLAGLSFPYHSRDQLAGLSQGVRLHLYQ
jgi:hypothetical protein